MARSNLKGDSREREWAAAIGGTKISRKGYEGPDVQSPKKRLRRNLYLWEVKSKENLPNWLTDWFAQMEREGADAIVFRQNRRPWYMIVQVDPSTDFDDVMLDQLGDDSVGDLVGLQNLKGIEHAFQVGDLGFELFDLLLQFIHSLPPQLQQAIAVSIGAPPDLAPNVDAASDGADE